jgi:DNA-binding IclR family transcriptional regulator
VASTSSTVRKALSVLDAVSGAPAGLTLSHIAADTRLNKATAVRLCATLEQAGLLERDVHMVYRLGRRTWRLGQMYRQQHGFEDIARPVIAALRDATGESASFYVRDGDERICLIRENSRHIIRHHVDEGARLSLDRGVVGRVLLAWGGAEGSEFDAIRADGYLIANGREPDTASVAAPVLNSEGGLVGAIVVSGPQTRFSEPRRRAALAQVLAACRDVQAALPGDRPRAVPAPREAVRPARPPRPGSRRGTPARPASPA